MFFDPAIACNYRCRMCYFSDDNYAGQKKAAPFTINEAELIARKFFPHLMKLQIGCGAEPTVYKHLTDIIRLGKKYDVPFISLTTNGALVTETLLTDMASAGLNELTISAHGFTKETYEYFMTGGHFESFTNLLKVIKKVKNDYPALSVRLNYTINKDNLEDLRYFDTLFADIPLDVIQLRPIQQIGNSEYQNFDTEHIKNKYEEILIPLIEKCRKRGIISIVPTKDNLVELQKDSVERKKETITDFIYCYVTPGSIWKESFDIKRDDLKSIQHKEHYGWRLFKNIFSAQNKKEQRAEVTKNLNYTIK